MSSRIESRAPRQTTALLDHLFEQVTAKVQAGEPVDIESYVQQYPEHAEWLRRLVPAIQTLADMGLSAICERPEDVRASDQQPISGTLGDFRIVREIGRGGMGVVYEAEEISLGRRVALKVLPFAAMLSQKHLQRFQNEARAAASLDHPHIVGVHSVGCERGVHYYAMHYVEGQTLADVIKQLRQEALPANRRLHAGSELSGARANGERGKAGEPQSTVLFDAGAESGERNAPMEAHQNDRLTIRSHIDSDQGDVTAAHGATADTDPLGLLSTGGSTQDPEFFQTVAKLGIQAAEALDHAHSMGVVHRDIKPSNMIVSVASSVAAGKRSERVNGDSSGAGGPYLWITDFGLAMTQNETNLTMSGDLLGTLRYMSPEQLQGDRYVLDHQTDIYSLGVTLYELITLEPAFPSEDRQALIHGIVEDDPRRPRQLNKAVPWELETIILKATAKEPDGRYATAGSLAEDLRRFLEDKPIRARRPSLSVRVTKWCYRHQTLVWMTGATLLILLAALTGTTLFVTDAYQGERNQRKLAEQQQRVAERQRRLAEEQEKLAKTQQRLAEEQREATENILYITHMRLVQKEWKEGRTIRLHNLLERYLSESDDSDRRGWEWYYWLSRCHRDKMTLQPRSLATPSVRWSPDGQSIASASSDEAVIVWDAKTGEKLMTVCGPGCSCVSWSPDGHHLAVGDDQGRIRVYEIPGADDVLTIAAHAARVHLLSWSPDGRHIASCGTEHTVKIWNAEDGRNEQILEGHSLQVRCLSWRPKAPRLATASIDTTVRIWDVDTGRAAQIFQPHWCEAYSVAWSPDGTRLATSGWGASNAKVWDAETLERQLFLNHSGPVEDVAWSPDNCHLATCTRSHNVRVWDTSTGESAFTLRGHKDAVQSVAWSPDGKQLLSSSRDGSIKVWDAQEQHDHVTCRSAEDPTTDGHQHRTVASEPFIEDTALWSPTGDKAAWIVSESAVAIGDPTSEQRFSIHEAEDAHVVALAWGPRGTRLATAGYSGEINIWNVTDWRRLHTLRGHPKDHYISTLAWNHDGRRLASGGWGHTVKIWDVTAGREICSLVGHTDSIRSVTWSPDGKRVASTSKQGILKIWDPVVGAEVLSLRGRGHSLMARWSEDGRRLSARHAETVTTWDASAGYEYAASPAYARQRARELYRRGVQRARAGRTRESDEAFDEARKVDAEFPAAYLARGSVYEERRDFVQAQADYTEAIQLGSVLQTARRRRAELHLRQGDLDAALNDAGDAVRFAPRLWQNWHTVGVARYRAKKWRAAKEAFATSQDLCRGGDASNRLFLAMTYWQLGDKSKAKHCYEKAEKRISQCDDEELLDLQGEAAKLLGGVVEALWRLGHSDRLWKSEQYGQAVVENRRAIELLEELTGDPPEQTDLRRRLAEAYLSLGQRLYGLERREDAKKILAKLRQRFPDQPKYADRLAHTYEFQDEVTGEHASPQLARLSRAIRLKPDSAPPFADRGKAYFENGDCDKAIEDFSQAFQFAPSDPELYRGRAGSYKERGEWAKAVADLDECIRLRGCAQDYQERGLIWLYAHAYDRAISDFNEAIRRNPTHAWRTAIELRGAAFLKKGQLAKALDHLDRAIKSDSEAHNAYYHRGCLHREKGNLEKALADFTQALSLRPHLALFRCQRAHVYAELGRTDEASVDLKEAVDITPGVARQMARLACLLASLPGELCRPERAIKLAKQAIEKSPTFPDAWEALGLAQYRTSNWQEAADALTKSLELSVHPTARCVLFLAMAHWKLGEKDEARRCYQRAVERLEKHEYADRDLRGLRREAAELLGIENQQEDTGEAASQTKPAEAKK